MEKWNDHEGGIEVLKLCKFIDLIQKLQHDTIRHNTVQNSMEGRMAEKIDEKKLLISIH